MHLCCVFPGINGSKRGGKVLKVKMPGKASMKPLLAKLNKLKSLFNNHFGLVGNNRKNSPEVFSEQAHAHED